MRIDVIVGTAEEASQLRKLADAHPGTEVRIFLAPASIDYQFPFPIVAITIDGNVIREYGHEAVEFFSNVLMKRDRATQGLQAVAR